eukprot:g12987.t1
MSPPPPPLLANALEVLFAVGALDRNCKLTHPIGSTLAEFPVDPRLGRMLLAAGELHCTEEILSIAAMLSVQSVFVHPRNYAAMAEKHKKKFAVFEGDHLTLLNVYNSFLASGRDANWCKQRYVNFKALKAARDIRQQLRKYCTRFKVPIVSIDNRPDNGLTPLESAATVLRKCIVHGFFMHAAQLSSGGRYKTVRGDQTLLIHPASVLFRGGANWVIYHDTQETTEKYMREVTAIDPKWLTDIAPHFYEFKTEHQRKMEQAGPPAEPGPSAASSAFASSAERLFGEPPSKKIHREIF